MVDKGRPLVGRDGNRKIGVSKTCVAPWQGRTPSTWRIARPSRPGLTSATRGLVPFLLASSTKYSGQSLSFDLVKLERKGSTSSADPLALLVELFQYLVQRDNRQVMSIWIAIDPVTKRATTLKQVYANCLGWEIPLLEIAQEGLGEITLVLVPKRAK